MSNPVLLIDSMYLAFSSYYAFRSMQTLQNAPTGALYGFVTRTEALIRELQPASILAAFDTREKTFRHHLFPNYKAHRQAPPEELLQQLPFIREYLDLRRIPNLGIPGFEGDDLIAYLALREAGNGHDVVIFTADKDMFQLVNERIRIYHPKTKQLLDRDGLKAFYGLFPEQIVDFLALTGDASDNIPGVPGIGEKTALKLIARFGSVDAMLARLDDVEPKVRAKIDTHIELLHLSRKLLDLTAVPPLPGAVDLPAFQEQKNDALDGFYTRFAFHSLIKKASAPEVGEASPPLVPYHVLRRRDELEALARAIQGAKFFAFDTETTALDFYASELVGISIALDNAAYYIPLRYPRASDGDSEIDFAAIKAVLGPLFGDPAIAKTGQNIKFDMLHLKAKGLDVNGVSDDSMLMSYLLYPNRRSHNLKDLAQEFLNYRQTTYDELVGKGKNAVAIDAVPLALISRYATDDAVMALRLCELLRPKLSAGGLLPLYRDIEVPLIEVLLGMEYQGVQIDRPFLQEAGRILLKRIAIAEKDIYAAASYTFNINSTQQLGELLFVKMGLPAGKKTKKTGSYSTDSDALSALQGFPIVAQIIDYRSFRKLHATYIEGLLQSCDTQSRVHTSFNQSVTATGRLSSSDPNLQNIPVGEMGGVNVRKAFVAKAGHRLLAADYSQIELRVLAHFSRDKRLQEAFVQDRDIHQHTADLVFGRLSMANPAELRRRAKIINFSIVYGSGPYSLSKELGIPFAEAKRFIDQYFDTYSGVRDFIAAVIAKAQTRPEVETIAGRRREIPEVLSANRNIRENGNRMAVNTIIQGSAADIIKIAMIRIHKLLQPMHSRLIMQVHDELVFEYPPAEEAQLLALVRAEMEHAVTLTVPLKVTCKTGYNWGEMTAVP